MSVLSRDEFLARISERIGDDTSETALSFLQDMTDTYNSMSGNSAEAVENARREEAEIWRKRYMNTFMSGTPVNNPDSVNRNDEPEEEKPKTFDELFK